MLLIFFLHWLNEWMNEYFSSYKSSLTPTCGIKPSIYEECQHNIIYGTPNFNIYFLFVYPKCHFVFLINWNAKLEIEFWFLFLYWNWDIKHKVPFRFFDKLKYEFRNEALIFVSILKLIGFSFFKIPEYWHSNLKFVFRFSF